MKTVRQAKNLTPKDQEFLCQCKQGIRRFAPNATVLLYGSRARGTQETDSDFDILVLTPSPLSAEEADKIRDVLYDLELEQGAVVSTLFYSRDQWQDPFYRVMPFHREVVRDGIEL